MIGKYHLRDEIRCQRYNNVYVNLKSIENTLGSQTFLLFKFSSSTNITEISVHTKYHAPDALLAFLKVHGMVRPWQLPVTAVVAGPPYRGAIDEDNEVHELCL